MNLEECTEPLARETAFWMMGLRDHQYPIDQLGQLSLKISEKLRAVGIILLLTKGDSDGFNHNLIRSGRSRLTYLKRILAVGATTDHHFACGRFEPLLDTIAAADFDLAQEILQHSPSKWREAHEYEDDFCYAQILKNLLQYSPPKAGIVTYLDRFEKFMEGKSSKRLDVCQALASQDQRAFDESFNDFLNDQESKIADDKVRGQLEEPQVVAQRHVSIEALALLRLTERQGLITEPEYRFCPSLARVLRIKDFPGE